MIGMYFAWAVVPLVSENMSRRFFAPNSASWPPGFHLFDIGTEVFVIGHRHAAAELGGVPHPVEAVVPGKAGAGVERQELEEHLTLGGTAVFGGREEASCFTAGQRTRDCTDAGAHFSCDAHRRGLAAGGHCPAATRVHLAAAGQRRASGGLLESGP